MQHKYDHIPAYHTEPEVPRIPKQLAKVLRRQIAEDGRIAEMLGKGASSGDVAKHMGITNSNWLVHRCVEIRKNLGVQHPKAPYSGVTNCHSETTRGNYDCCARQGGLMLPVHEYIAHALCPRRGNQGLHVHHLDGDGRNQHPSNLALCSNSEHQHVHHDGDRRAIKLLIDLAEPGWLGRLAGLELPGIEIDDWEQYAGAIEKHL